MYANDHHLFIRIALAAAASFDVHSQRHIIVTAGMADQRSLKQGSLGRPDGLVNATTRPQRRASQEALSCGRLKAAVPALRRSRGRFTVVLHVARVTPLPAAAELRTLEGPPHRTAP